MADLSDLTDEQLEQVALGNMTLDEALGKKPAYTADNIHEMSDEQLQMVMDGVPISEIKKERNELVGMGSSLGGALAGAAAGTAILPGIGTAIGGLIGGAVGAFGGELAEDQLQGEDLNYANAAKEAAISAGIDVATLGAAKFAKPAYYAGKRALGFTTEEVAKDIVEKAAATRATQVAGTQTALQSGAELLAEKGAVFTPTQVGGRGILAFYDNIGRSGVLSSAPFKKNMELSNEAVSGAINDLVGQNQAGVLLKGELGDAVHSVFVEGKKALGKQYELGLNDVMSSLTNNTINVLPIHKSIDGFIKSYSSKLGKTQLQDGTIKLLRGIQNDLSGGFKLVDEVKEVKVSYTNAFGQKMTKTEKQVVGKKKIPQPIPAAQLIEWQKKVNKVITEAGNPLSPMYNRAVDAELAKVSSALSGSIDKVMTKVNPEAFGKYKAINQVYKKGIKTLRPDNIKSIVNSAAKEDYDRLGKVMLQEGVTNFGQFKNTWKALNYSVKAMKPQQLTELGFKNQEDLYQTIRASYMQNMFPNTNAVDFDMVKYANKMSKLSREELKQAKLILGKDYGRFNQIRNTIITASTKPGSDVGILSLRSKELGTLGAVAVGSVTGIAGGVAALLAPKMMAKVALNPKTSAMLINAMGRSSKTAKGLDETRKMITAILAAEGVDLAAEPFTSPN